MGVLPLHITAQDNSWSFFVLTTFLCKKQPLRFVHLRRRRPTRCSSCGHCAAQAFLLQLLHLLGCRQQLCSQCSNTAVTPTFRVAL